MSKESRFSTSKMLQEDFSREASKPTGSLISLLYRKPSNDEQLKQSEVLDNQIPTPLDNQTEQRLVVQNLNYLDNQSPQSSAIQNPPTAPQTHSSNLPETKSLYDHEQEEMRVQNGVILDNQSAPSLGNNLVVQKPSSRRNLDGKTTKKKGIWTTKHDWRKYEQNRERSGARGRWDCRPLNSILNKIEHYMVDAKLSKQDWFEKASLLLIDYLDNQTALNLDVNTSTDDDRLMMAYSTKVPIINLYRRITENNWTARDDAVGVSYNDRDLRIIEIAMIRTKIRSMRNKTVIKWFKYFKDEIDDHLIMLSDIPTAAIEAQLTSGRKLLDLAKQGIEVDA